MRPRASERVARGETLVIAHRGASADAPENTLPAFRLALEAKADLVELDTHHSADDVPMVFHDKDLKRTTDAQAVFGKTRLRVAERTRAELERLDAGTWFDARFAGTRIPTLEEALDVIQRGSMTLVERKSGDAETLVALLRRKGLLDTVVVQSFDWDFLADCRRLAPDLLLGALGSRSLDDAKLTAVRACGAAVVGWNHKYITPDVVARVHAAGFKLWVYTVNDDVRAVALAAMGVDGIISDRPAAIRAALAGAPK